MKWFFKNLIIKHLGNMKSERNFQLLWVFDGQWCWRPSISKDYMNIFSDTVGMCFMWGSLSTWVCSPWVVEEWSLRYDVFFAFNWWNFMIFSILKGNKGHVILKLNVIQEYRFRLSKFWNVEAVGFYFVSDIFYLYVLMCPRNIVLLCFNFCLILGFSFYLFLDFFFEHSSFCTELFNLHEFV